MSKPDTSAPRTTVVVYGNAFADSPSVRTAKAQEIVRKAFGMPEPSKTFTEGPGNRQQVVCDDDRWEP